MTITFKSQASADLIMLQASADALLSRLGKQASEQGILEPKDMPAALATLRGLPPDEADVGSAPASTDSEDAGADGGDEPRDPAFADEPVTLRQRAWPLIQMIERSLEAGKPVVWGV